VPVRSACADEQQDTAAVALRGRPRVERNFQHNPHPGLVVPAVCGPLEGPADPRRCAIGGRHARGCLLVCRVLEQLDGASVALRGWPRMEYNFQ
jgi:hypothetical protein